MKLNTPVKGENFFFNRDTVKESHGKKITESHYHNMFEIYYITDGECSYFIDNKTYSLIPGDKLSQKFHPIINQGYSSVYDISLQKL